MVRHHIYAIKNSLSETKVEYHGSSKLAYRACLILNAHEKKNGRPMIYQVIPPCDVIPMKDLNLPSWVEEAFNEVLNQK